MFYFLNRIDDYIRNNGIPFKSIEISSDYLPKYFNHAILCALRDSGSFTFDMFAPEKYVLDYDSDNNLYLEAVGSDGRTKILIYSSLDYARGISSKEVGYKTSDGYLYRKGCLIKYNMKRQKEIMNVLNETYSYKELKDKVKALHKLMRDVYDECYEQYGNGIYSLADYSKEMDMAADNIIAYIEYLNICYKEDLEEYNNKRMVAIKFIPALADTISRKSGNGRGTRERVNSILPVDDRVKVLDTFGYKYCCTASPYDSNNTDYYCYLYDTFDSTPILVMEPYCGTKYTRVVYLDKCDYSKEEFALLCKKYLELSNNESYETNRVVRFNHTDIGDFEDNLELVINGSSKGMRKDYEKCKRLAKVRNNL